MRSDVSGGSDLPVCPLLNLPPMGDHLIQRFDSASALAAGVAGLWIERLACRHASSPVFTVALPGGRIARDLFGSTARIAAERGVSLRDVAFFWGDERCVAPEDRESNFRAAHEGLLAPMRVPAARIHRIRGELQPEVAARDAAAELVRLAPAGAAGRPALDLVFLGMGEDGHVASLFPGESDAVMDSAAIYRAVTASKPPPRRITLGYGVLAAAREVWVLASGPGKEAALRESLQPEGTTPLARLIRLRERTAVFTDIA